MPTNEDKEVQDEATLSEVSSVGSQYETKGYHVEDSLQEVDQHKSNGDVILGDREGRGEYVYEGKV